MKHKSNNLFIFYVFLNYSLLEKPPKYLLCIPLVSRFKQLLFKRPKNNLQSNNRAHQTQICLSCIKETDSKHRYKYK